MCVAEDWWRLGRRGCLQAWPGHDGEPLPWKAKRSVLLQVPGADHPSRIRTDLAHTWGIGVGKEFCASALLTISDLGLVGGNSLEGDLASMYQEFRLYCYNSKQTCKINEFSKRAVKIAACLGSVKLALCNLPWFHFVIVALSDFDLKRVDFAQAKPVSKVARAGPRLLGCQQVAGCLPSEIH